MDSSISNTNGMLSQSSSGDSYAVFLATFVTAFVSYKILRLYNTRRSLPNGPFPWPLIGNLMSFNQPDMMPYEIINQLSQQYGPVFSLFLGHMPCVVITDPVIGLQTLKKTSSAGRPNFGSNKFILKNNSIDIAMADYSEDWLRLKSVSQAAIHKYVRNKRSTEVVVVEAVDRIVGKIGAKGIEADHFLTLLVNTVSAEAAFGQMYDSDDPEFINWCRIVDDVDKGLNVVNIVAFAAVLRFVFWKRWNKFMCAYDEMEDYVRKMFAKAQLAPGDMDTSFCSAFITAKREAEATDSRYVNALSEQNLYLAMYDLFVAGTDTTKNTIKWMILLMCKYPEYQRMLREEVIRVVGDNEPNLDHRTQCHLLYAFIHETLRFKPNVPTAIPHKVIDKGLIIDGHDVPIGTTLLFSLANSLNDKKIWGDAEVFRPERFLDEDGRFCAKKNEYFIPFSAGRRSCPGEKLALNNIFLITARLLQRTSDIVIPDGVSDAHMRGDTRVTISFNAIPFFMKLIPVTN